MTSINLENLPRFPVPPAQLMGVVSTAYAAVHMQVLRSAVAAKQALGFDFEEEALELHINEDAAEFHGENEIVQYNDQVEDHRRGTRRYRECHYAWPCDGTIPSSDERIKHVILEFDNFRNWCASDYGSDADDQRGVEAYDFAKDFLSSFSDEEIAKMVAGGKFKGLPGDWTVDSIRTWEATFFADGGVVDSAWLNAIFAAGPEQTEALTHDAINRMGKCGFSPTFTAAAQWLYDHAAYKMPATVEAGIMFLRTIARWGVAASGPSAHAQALAERIDMLPKPPLVPGAKGRETTPGASAKNWSTAAHILVTEQSMLKAMNAAPELTATSRARSPRASL